MSDRDERTELGDLLAPGSDFLKSLDAASLSHRVTAREAEEVVAALARFYGINAADALKEFRSSSTLAKLARAMIGLGDDRPDSFGEAVDMIAQVRSEGLLKGYRVYVEASKRLCVKDAAGVITRSVTPGSLKTYWKQSKATERKQGLARLFVDFPRSRRKG